MDMAMGRMGLNGIRMVGIPLNHHLHQDLDLEARTTNMDQDHLRQLQINLINQNLNLKNLNLKFLNQNLKRTHHQHQVEAQAQQWGQLQPLQQDWDQEELLDQKAQR